MSGSINLDSNQDYENTSSVETSKTTVNIDLSLITDLTIDNDASGTLESTGKRGIDTSGTAGTGVSLTINNQGSIIGDDDAIRVDSPLPDGTLTLDNSGTIESTDDGQAVDFNSVTAGATIRIINEAGGTITSTDADAIRPGADATIENAGSIYAGGENGASKNDAIDFQDFGGTVTNTGTISGARHAITSSTDVTVINDVGGNITGRDGSGVGSDGNGTVTNYGTITGAYDGSGTGDGDGVDIDGYAIVTNYGTIQGTGAAGNGSDGLPNTSESVSIGGGEIDNEAGAVISGANNGILVDDSSQGNAPYATTIINNGTIEGLDGYAIHITDTFGDTITNSGLISGTTGAIVLGSGDDTLNILTGSMISGTVDGGGGNNTVNLSGSGTFDGAINFQTMTVSGSWTLSGSQAYSAITLANGAELTIEGITPGTETITFGSGSGLILEDLSGFSAAITNFAVGDSLDFSSLSYSANLTMTVIGQTVTISDGTTSYTLSISLADNTDMLNLAEDSDGSVLLQAAVCFLPGSLIATADAELAVETLRPGMLVQTFNNGAPASKEIVWVGRQKVTVPSDLPPDMANCPVRICRNALQDGVPHQDLLVTPEHCLYFDGRFIPVRMLVNGASIHYEHGIHSYECYHIETRDHSVIRANGLLTESYLDTGNRRHFQPAAEGTVIRAFNGRRRSWQKDAAAALCVDRHFAEPLHARILERALLNGLALPAAPPTDSDPALHLQIADGQLLQPFSVVNGHYVFRLPPDVQELRLMSRTARPADMIGPFVDDRRMLGVLIGRVILFEAGRTSFMTDHLGLDLPGWHAKEEAAPGRWTAGNAVLPLPKRRRHEWSVLSLEVKAGGPYASSGLQVPGNSAQARRA